MRRSAVAVVLVLALAAALSLGTARTQAGAQPHMIPGHWQGFDASSVTGLVETFTMDIGTFTDGVAPGTLYASAGTIPFQVTVSADGRRFSATSVVSTATAATTARRQSIEFTASGKLSDLAGGTTLGNASYRFRTPAGIDKGKLTFLRSFDSTAPAQLGRSADGGALRDDGTAGPLSLDVTGQTDSSFQGSVTLGDAQYPMLGTVGNPDQGGFAPVDTLEVSSFGTLLMQGSIHGGAQPHMFGTISASFADGSSSSFSFGLLVPAV
ncbi:MAG: hypothetical protein ACXVZ2_10215 [Gaiellaceae bacterium]